jgi:lipoprotein-anchoring transpeptidase ErfK/SrfK
MILPNPPGTYLQAYFAPVLQQIARLLTTSYQKGSDIELNADQRLIIVSPNGTRYQIIVDNSGTLSTSTVS